VDHWFHGDGAASDDLHADAAALGVILPDDAVKPQKYEIWPEHEDAVLMFLRCQTQWRVSSSGVMGLDYGVVLELFRLYDVQDPRRTLEDLQVMEARARELINQAANEKPKRSAKRGAR
jgi:hypothetical protein